MSLIWTPSGYSKMKPPLGTPLNPYDPLSRGLIGCWLLNEGAGTVVRDASGNGFHGTNSAATWTSGAFGPCMAFNGTDAFVDIPGKNMLYPLTMCCWVRLNVNNIVQVLLYLGDGVESGSATDLVCLRVNSEGTPLATAWRGSAGNSATGTTVLVPGVWYHLAAVFVHSTMREIYVNGVLEATNSKEEVIAGSKVYWSIGAWRLSAGGAQYHANALIDAPQFYNRALTPSEIASLYRDPYQMFRRPAIELWTVEEGGGQQTFDDAVVVTVEGQGFADDLLDLADGVNAVVAGVPTAGDAAAAVDAVVVSVGGGASVVDYIVHVDSVASIATIKTSAADLATFTEPDLWAETGLSASVEDAVVGILQDAVSATAQAGANVVDLVSFVESAAWAEGGLSAAADDAIIGVLEDDVMAVVSAGAAISDTATLTDAVAATSSGQVAATDALVFPETVAAGAIAVAAGVDGMVYADAITATVGGTASAGELGYFSDTVSTIVTMTSPVTDRLVGIAELPAVLFMILKKKH